MTKGFSEADLTHIFSGEEPCSADVYRELISIHQGFFSVAVALASAAVREALAVLKAAATRLESSGDLRLKDLPAAVKGPRTSVEKDSTSGEITNIEQLGAALGTGDKITGDEKFDRALGISGEADGLETSWNGTRKWRDSGRLEKE